MPKLLTFVLFLAGAGAALHPVPADAQGTDAEHAFAKCTAAVIEQCDALFPGSGPLTVVARGWCYLAGTTQCLGDPEDLER